MDPAFIDLIIDQMEPHQGDGVNYKYNNAPNEWKNHGRDGGNVVFCDGHASWIPRAQWKAMITSGDDYPLNHPFPADMGGPPESQESDGILEPRAGQFLPVGWVPNLHSSKFSQLAQIWEHLLNRRRHARRAAEPQPEAEKTGILMTGKWESGHIPAHPETTVGLASAASAGAFRL